MHSIHQNTKEFLQNFVLQSILLKIASRCNINCRYCYWFEDDKVYKHPNVLSIAIENLFLFRLDEHLRRFKMRKFTIYLHGGEPLLFGKKRFASLCRKLRILEYRRQTRIQILVQTNGILIDDEWAEIFRILQVAASVSIDGPKEIHDERRKGFDGEGSFEKSTKAIACLKKHGLNPGILAVYHPGIDAASLCSFFVNKLEVNWFDVLFPDPVQGAPPPKLGTFYQELFDCWFFDYRRKGITIRVAENLLGAYLGEIKLSDAIGFGPFTTSSITTDGKFETCDTFHSLSGSAACTPLCLEKHCLQDIVKATTWLDSLDASLNLSETCKNCKFMTSCGGGYVPHRWRKETGFNNPSLYCDDLRGIFSHIGSRVQFGHQS